MCTLASKPSWRREALLFTGQQGKGGMTDFFWCLSLAMILSLQSPIFSLHGEESGVKWGGGQKKRGLTSLIKSRLVYAIGRYQSWWRKRKRMWSKGQCSQVQMWWWWGGGILRGLQDVFSDGLHLKRGAFTFCSPLLLKIPTSSRPPVSSVLNPDFTKKDSALPKMLSFSRWITLDKSRMIIMSTLDTDASCFYQCEFR